MGSSLKQVAVELTECDLKRYNQYLVIINHPLIPVYQKKEAAVFVKEVNGALKALQEKVDEKAFNIFYNSYFAGLDRSEIAFKLKVDPTTITRNRQKVLHMLSIILYPDLNTIETINALGVVT